MPETPSISWDALFSELVRFVATKVRDRSTAEDIVQEVFIKVYTKASQIKEADRISGWIYQVTRNAVADHFRQRSKIMKPINVDWESTPNDFNDCVARCLTQLMSSMPEKYRVPLQLVEVDNLSQYEVAEKLNISYSGARSRIQRGRKILKQKLDELYDIKSDSYGNILSCEDKIPCCCVRKC